MSDTKLKEKDMLKPCQKCDEREKWMVSANHDGYVNRQKLEYFRLWMRLANIEEQLKNKIVETDQGRKDGLKAREDLIFDAETIKQNLAILEKEFIEDLKFKKEELKLIKQKAIKGSYKSLTC